MRNMKKILSFLLVLSMVLSYVPMPALAEEITCTHHVHDESCGFVEGKVCNHVHGEGCGDVTVPSCAHVHGTEGCTFVAGTPAVSCHPDHNEDCGYVVGFACECDLSEGREHLENCGYVAAVSCNVTHEGCGCVAAVPASGECNHTCTACFTTTFACVHTAHDKDCGYVEAKPCTFDPAACEACKVIANLSADWCGNPLCSQEDNAHAPACKQYVRTYEDCKCVLNCAEEGLNDWCETCYFEGVEACGGGAEEEQVPLNEDNSADVVISLRATDSERNTLAGDLSACLKVSEYEEVWITNYNTTEIYDISVGATYTLDFYEDCAWPEGYLLPKDITFTVNQNGKIEVTSNNATLEVKDGTTYFVVMLQPAPKLALRATDSASNTLAGELNAYLKVSEYEEAWIANYQPTTIYYFCVGTTYTLDFNEDCAWPAGYQLPEDISFTVGQSGEIIVSGNNATVEVEDGITYFVVVLQDASESEPDPESATELALRAVNAENQTIEEELDAALGDYWISNNYTTTVDDLSVDKTYTLDFNENSYCPEGYQLPEDITFTVGQNGEIEVTSNNATVEVEDGTNYFVVVLQDASESEPDPESAAKLALRAVNAENQTIEEKLDAALGDYWINNNYATAVDDLSVDRTYTLDFNEASDCPDGYQLPEDITFTVGQNGEIEVTSNNATVEVEEGTTYFIVVLQSVSAHQHQWTYEMGAEKDTLKASCSDDTCEENDTLGIGAGDATYNGSAFSPTVYGQAGDYKREDYQNQIVFYKLEGENYVLITTFPTDAGTYKATVTVDAEKNYVLEKTYTIHPKTLTDNMVTLSSNEAEYKGENIAPTVTVKDGNLELDETVDYIISYEKVNENASATPINGAPTDAGTYNAIIIGKGNYGGEIRKSFEIKPNANITVEPEALDAETYTGEEIKPVVTVKGVKLTALEKNKDYTVAYENNINAGTAKVIITGIGNYAGAKKELEFTIHAKELTDANVTIKETVLAYKAGQTTVPEITVKDGDKTLAEGTDYVVGYLDKDGKKVEQPSATGTYTVQVIGVAALSEDGSGNYAGSVSKAFVITDDVTAPEITGVTSGKTYYTTQKAIAKDTNLVSVTKNGTQISPVVPAGTEVTLQGNTTATYTVTAVDIAELDASVTITMKPISTLDDTIENLTVDNVKLSDKDTIQAVLDRVNPIRKDECGNASQAETDALDAIIKKCNDLLKVIIDAEDAISKIQAMPNPAETAPDNETAVKAYDEAKKVYDALSEHGKELVGTENKAKLDAMLKALTAYDIIKQSSKSYVKGSYKALTFTANGYFGKFTGVEVDGKTVDAKYYDAKSGSTIITLKTSYLESLSVGKHTIKVNYIDGSTDGEDTFRISVNNGNPFTGDDTHMMLFSGIMMTSLLCMAMMIVFFPRKKGKYQR